ncbi:MAG: flagellar hook-length control protein FliK [Geminicoccaceae bacterium]
MRLALELPRLGAVRAELALVAGRVTVGLVAGPAGAAALGGRLGELRRSLAALALDAECAVRPAADG